MLKYNITYDILPLLTHFNTYSYHNEKWWDCVDMSLTSVCLRGNTFVERLYSFIFKPFDKHKSIKLSHL